MKLKYVLIVLILLGFVNIALAGISYNAASDLITVTGYTEITPCTFNNLYNADISGGWGVINKQGNNQFYITTRLCFGDGLTETWFADTGKHIIINASGYPFCWGYRIRICDNAHFRLGTLISEINKTSSDGCCVKFHSDDGMTDLIIGDANVYDRRTGTLELYSSQFLSNHRGCIYNLYNTTIYNCIFAKNVELNRLYNSDINFVSISDSQYGTVLVTGNLTNIRNLEMTNYGTHYNNGCSKDVIMKGCEFINCSKLCEMQGWDVSYFSLYLIDVISNTWKIDYCWSSKSKLYRQYTFNLETTPNAEITICNNRSVVYNDFADVNGIVNEQTLTMGHYIESTGGVLNSQNPYSIEIKKHGYHTYKQKFTLCAPIKWHIKLVPDRIEVGSDIIRANRR